MNNFNAARNNLQRRCSVAWGRIINTSKMNVNMYFGDQSRPSFFLSVYVFLFLFFSSLKRDEGPRQGILGHDCISWCNLFYLNTHSVNPNYIVSYKFQPKTVGLTLRTHWLSQVLCLFWIKKRYQRTNYFTAIPSWTCSALELMRLFWTYSWSVSRIAKLDPN